jgi:hypothetical protein
MFTVGNEDIGSFLLWAFACVMCFCAVTALLIRWICAPVGKDLVMVIGYAIPGILILIIPLSFPSNHLDKNISGPIPGLIAASSLFLINLTEVCII